MQLLLWLLLFISFSAMSHQTSRTATLKEVKWNYINVPIRVDNESATLGNATALIDQSIAEWNSASAYKIQRVSSSSNQIKFVRDFSIYGSAVVGLTEVNYNNSGVINSANVLLNEDNYQFVSTPGIAYGNYVYLKDVVTHELGHFSGLSHSEVLNSSMFYQTFPGQAELAADDKAGVRSKYDSGYGKIYGHVMGGGHVGVLGVHVQAISRKTGESIGVVSDINGYFEINGLDLNDTYYIRTGSLKNLGSLQSYLANVQTDFCPASYVTSFFSQCGNQYDGIPQSINLTSSQRSINLGEISISCTLRIQEDYLEQKIQSPFNPIEIFNYQAEPRNEKSYVGYFDLSDLNESNFVGSDKFVIDLNGLSSASGKNLKLRLISQTMGNPAEFMLIVRKNNVAVTGSPFTRTFNADGTLNLDLTSLTALSANPSLNVFQIEVLAKKLTSAAATLSIPDAINFASTQTLPYLLVISLESGGTPLMDSGALLSDNSTCLDAPFTHAVAYSTASSDETKAQAATQAGLLSCGTIEPPQGPGNGPGSFLMIASFGFLLAFLSSSLVKRGKNFLS